MTRKKTLFKRRHTNFQPKATISLRYAGVRMKSFRKNGERGIPCSDKTFLSKESGGLRKSKPSWMKFTGRLHQRRRLFTFGSKNAKTVSSAGKVMAIVFWDAQGIIRIEYLQKGKKITREYYATLLSRSHKNGTSEIGAQNNSFLSRQLTGSHFRSFNGKNAWIKVQTFTASTLFSWFCYFWLLFISKPQALVRGKKIFVWWGGYHRCGWVFQKLWNFLLIRGDKRLEEHWTKCVEVESDYFGK